MRPELGIIEGYFGRAWSWVERAETAAFLGERGYGFYLYAPKADAYLRRRWRADHPGEEAERLADFAARCAELGVRFGVGLSPYEVWTDWGATAKEALARKLAFFDDLGARDVAILFDDMKSDVPDLAARQAEVVAFARERSGAERLFVCPSYYSMDPVLDRVFGRRPAHYLEDLGRLLDPAVEVFWTGEEVVSREYSPGHLDAIAERLQRRPFLWDNYPVNDGHRMSQYLHLRAFTGRPSSLAEHVAGHGINPALQPVLTRIPALTLLDSYDRGPDYRYGESFRRAAQTVLGRELGDLVRDDLLTLQDVGLDRLGDRAEALRARYDAFDDAGAREIVAWLDGEYRITDDLVKTQ